MFQGHRDRASRLWMVDLEIFQPKNQSASPAVEVNNKQEFVLFWHAAFGYPTKSSFIRNIKNGNIQIDNLTAETVRKHFVPSIFTAYGHLDATRSNIKSTKKQTKSGNNTNPEQPSIWIDVHKSTGRLHTDQTGQLPVLGRNNEKYIAIYFDESTNYIHTETLNSDSGIDILAATKRAIQFFTTHGSPTVHLRLDNKLSSHVRQYLSKEQINIELTPVGQHRRNKAERAIRTFKNHFVATLAGVDKECPLELWPEFLDQIDMTLNIMRTSSAGLSAWSALHGPVDFNKTPIAPLGIKVVAHVPADRRASWANHRDVGFYVGRALEHYRCYKVWITKTKDFRISDCLAWFPVFNDTNHPASHYPTVPPGFDPLPPQSGWKREGGDGASGTTTTK